MFKREIISREKKYFCLGLVEKVNATYSKELWVPRLRGLLDPVQHGCGLGIWVLHHALSLPDHLPLQVTYSRNRKDWSIGRLQKPPCWVTSLSSRG